MHDRVDSLARPCDNGYRQFSRDGFAFGRDLPHFDLHRWNKARVSGVIKKVVDIEGCWVKIDGCTSPLSDPVIRTFESKGLNSQSDTPAPWALSK